MFWILFISIMIVIICFKFKIKIKIKSFLKRGFLPVRGDFGVYCYCGKQGTGKTYSVVEYLLDNREHIEVFCNIADISNITYTHFIGFKGLIDLKEKLDKDELIYDKKKQLVFVYDEIFTELMKGSKLDKPVMDFLCQMRKRKIIFLTTAQEWAEIPLTFRRFCRYEIDCKMINLFFVGILLKHFKDAENMKWSDEEQEHVAPLVSNTITKTRKWIANSYNTFLRISSVSPETPSTASSEETVIEQVEVSSLENGISEEFTSENMPDFVLDTSKTQDNGVLLPEKNSFFLGSYAPPTRGEKEE